MSNKKKMGGIKKGLIVSLIGAVVLMSVLFASLLQAAPTVQGSTTPSVWIGRPDKLVLAWNFTLTNDTGGATMNLTSVNLTFEDISGTLVPLDFESLAATNLSGVCLYKDDGDGIFDDTADTLLNDDGAVTGYGNADPYWYVNISGIDETGIGSINLLVVLNISAPNANADEIFNISLRENIGYEYVGVVGIT
ncbi:MAG: hypothetical protein KJ655_00445, partial [Candidatus Thermoplasmatota archaeon]|nr:hypothetical protein [Candidatus Thermoplasmatota archaeon]